MCVNHEWVGSPEICTKIAGVASRSDSPKKFGGGKNVESRRQWVQGSVVRASVPTSLDVPLALTPFAPLDDDYDVRPLFLALPSPSERGGAREVREIMQTRTDPDRSKHVLSLCIQNFNTASTSVASHPFSRI
mmetsp:Transcript_1411/g.1867  ORF Transcript_1411/g.1867 Transcript_1411/m.1867 type:complete len:133 (+) Transcript_1411:1-399(+)